MQPSEHDQNPLVEDKIARAKAIAKAIKEESQKAKAARAKILADAREAEEKKAEELRASFIKVPLTKAKSAKVKKAKVSKAKRSKKAAHPEAHKDPVFALKVAKWGLEQNRAITASEIADHFNMAIWQARKMLHYMMTIPGVIACLDWGYPQDTKDKVYDRPTRLLSIMKVAEVNNDK